MLDLIVCSTSLHKRVKHCYVASDGLDSDYRAVRMQLNLTLLKYKDKASTNGGVTDPAGERYVKMTNIENFTTSIY